MHQRHLLLLILPIAGSRVHAQIHCTPQSLSSVVGTDHAVTRVQLDSIQYGPASGFSVTWWDYTYRGDSSTTRLLRGNTYTIGVRSGTAVGTDHAAWLDWYGTPAGFQSDELLGSAENSTAYEVLDFAFTVPLDAMTGYRTLRVRAGENMDTNDPCDTVGYGESEDYIVLIQDDICIPLMYYGTSGGDSISAVAVDGMSLALDPGPSAYKDMTSISFTGAAGSTTNVEVTTGAYANDRVGIWADWNNDGVFDANEAVGDTLNTTAYEVLVIPMTIPGAISAPVSVRLRVRLWYGWSVDACQDLYHGQTIDYTLNIDVGTSVIAAASDPRPWIVANAQEAALVAGSEWLGASILITDVSGRSVFNGTVTDQRTPLPLSECAAGVHVIHLRGAAGGWTDRFALPR